MLEQYFLRPTTVDRIRSNWLAPAPTTIFLEREEIDALFKALPRYGGNALRDRALLMVLYNSGARVQEIADLRVGDVDLDRPLRVRLHAKATTCACRG
jgi:integrase